MVSSNPIKVSETVVKFLKDPEISHDIKDMCIRLMQNPIIRNLLQQTPASTIFEICQEYKKYPDLYDDVFCGRIKFFLKGMMHDAVPIFNYKKLEKDNALNEFIGPKTFTGQVVEKFGACEPVHNEVKRIMVKIEGNKMLTAAFNSENKIVSMLIDTMEFEHEHKSKALMSFLNKFSTQRVDLIRA